jgi:hypothetical protein
VVLFVFISGEFQALIQLDNVVAAQSALAVSQQIILNNSKLIIVLQLQQYSELFSYFAIARVDCDVFRVVLFRLSMVRIFTTVVVRCVLNSRTSPT